MNLNEDIDRIKQVMGIITESNTIRFRRHIPFVEEIVQNYIKSFGGEKPFAGITKGSFCDVFRDSKSFVTTAVSEVAERLYYAYYYDFSDESNEWSEMYRMVDNYVKKRYGNDLTIFWETYCAN